MIYCSNCGTGNRDGSRFCNECGQRLGTLLPCPSCGFPNLSTARFCNNCALQLISAPESDANPVEPLPVDLVDDEEPLESDVPNTWAAPTVVLDAPQHQATSLGILDLEPALGEADAADEVAPGEEQILGPGAAQMAVADVATEGEGISEHVDDELSRAVEMPVLSPANVASIARDARIEDDRTDDDRIEEARADDLRFEDDQSEGLLIEIHPQPLTLNPQPSTLDEAEIHPEVTTARPDFPPPWLEEIEDDDVIGNDAFLVGQANGRAGVDAPKGAAKVGERMGASIALASSLVSPPRGIFSQTTAPSHGDAAAFDSVLAQPWRPLSAGEPPDRGSAGKKGRGVSGKKERGSSATKTVVDARRWPTVRIPVLVGVGAVALVTAVVYYVTFVAPDAMRVIGEAGLLALQQGLDLISRMVR
ncbi:MAG: zinc ribbon domain-containing protein [Chloroflexi bacterium]|nr:zinc ribbon domain-containing protein [Chloroflexota bacterium]